jgi:hypothetical protein
MLALTLLPTAAAASTSEAGWATTRGRVASSTSVLSLTFRASARFQSSSDHRCSCVRALSSTDALVIPRAPTTATTAEAMPVPSTLSWSALPAASSYAHTVGGAELVAM